MTFATRDENGPEDSWPRAVACAHRLLTTCTTLENLDIGARQLHAAMSLQPRSAQLMHPANLANPTSGGKQIRVRNWQPENAQKRAREREHEM